jgi:hypothetical protein
LRRAQLKEGHKHGSTSRQKIRHSRPRKVHRLLCLRVRLLHDERKNLQPDEITHTRVAIGTAQQLSRDLPTLRRPSMRRRVPERSPDTGREHRNHNGRRGSMQRLRMVHKRLPVRSNDDSSGEESRVHLRQLQRSRRTAMRQMVPRRSVDIRNRSDSSSEVQNLRSEEPVPGSQRENTRKINDSNIRLFLTLILLIFCTFNHRKSSQKSRIQHQLLSPKPSNLIYLPPA